MSKKETELAPDAQYGLLCPEELPNTENIQHDTHRGPD